MVDWSSLSSAWNYQWGGGADHQLSLSHHHHHKFVNAHKEDRLIAGLPTTKDQLDLHYFLPALCHISVCVCVFCHISRASSNGEYINQWLPFTHWIWRHALKHHFGSDSPACSQLFWRRLDLEEDCGGLVLKLSFRIVHSILWIFAHLFLESRELPNIPTHMVRVFGTSFFWKEIALEINQIYLSFLKLATSRDRLWVQFLLAFDSVCYPWPLCSAYKSLPSCNSLFFGSLWDLDQS